MGRDSKKDSKRDGKGDSKKDIKKDSKRDSDKQKVSPIKLTPRDPRRDSKKDSKRDGKRDSKKDIKKDSKRDSKSRHDEAYTTIKLKNIPVNQTRAIIVQKLSEKFSGHFDLVYLPVDLENLCNVGHALINFRSQEQRERFAKLYHGVPIGDWFPGEMSKHKLDVTRATVQGLEANLKRIRERSIMKKLAESPASEWIPLLFDAA